MKAKPKLDVSEKQLEYYAFADARWNVATGAVRSGKTYGTFIRLPKRFLEMPPGNILFAGKTERTLKRNVLSPLRVIFGTKRVSEPYGEGEIDVFGRHCYIVGANDERAVTKIQGIGLVYAYGDEITTWPESFFNMLKSRLSERGACFDGTCNPEGPNHWLKREFLDKAGFLNINTFQFHIDDNPFLEPDFVEQLKREYTGVWYQRFIEGRWVIAEGVVYDVFDERIHVLSAPPGKARKHYVSIDYGTTNPTVFGLYAVNERNFVWKVKEYYYDPRRERGQKTDTEFSHALAKFVGAVKPRAIIVDPSAASFKLQLKRDGFSNVIDANNEVLDGIRTQSRMLQTGQYKIMNNCTQTIEDYGAYVWDEKAQERGEDKPIKKDDHTKDEERYFLHTIFGNQHSLKTMSKRKLGL